MGGQEVDQGADRQGRPVGQGHVVPVAVAAGVVHGQRNATERPVVRTGAAPARRGSRRVVVVDPHADGNVTLSVCDHAARGEPIGGRSPEVSRPRSREGAPYEGRSYRGDLSGALYAGAPYAGAPDAGAPYAGARYAGESPRGGEYAGARCTARGEAELPPSP